MPLKSGSFCLDLDMGGIRGDSGPLFSEKGRSDTTGIVLYNTVQEYY